VLAQDPESAPRRPKRGRRPLCHTSCRRLWEGFRAAVRALGQAYRAASAAFRGGQFLVEFPSYVHRPPGVVVVPVAAAAGC
jgi:hypothetical protein